MSILLTRIQLLNIYVGLLKKKEKMMVFDEEEYCYLHKDVIEIIKIVLLYKNRL